MLKKSISILLSLIISTSLCMTNVSAETQTINDDEITVMYLYTSNCSSTLSISSGKATCTSNATGYSGETTKISVLQTLQKKNSNGTWTNAASWSSSVNSYQLNKTSYRYNLTSGTYRLVSEFNVYSGNNYETITKTSSNITI